MQLRSRRLCFARIRRTSRRLNVASRNRAPIYLTWLVVFRFVIRFNTTFLPLRFFARSRSLPEGKKDFSFRNEVEDKRKKKKKRKRRNVLRKKMWLTWTGMRRDDPADPAIGEWERRPRLSSTPLIKSRPIVFHQFSPSFPVTNPRAKKCVRERERRTVESTWIDD